MLASNGPVPPAEEKVRAELARIVAAPQFAASAHLRDFLSFVVEAALTGRGKEITASRIGAEVLKRGERFDSSTDPSESPTYGVQEGTAWNGRFCCTCYHPLFVFNQFGDLERCALRRPR